MKLQNFSHKILLRNFFLIPNFYFCSDETKRIIMDLDVVLKSNDCEEIVLCLGCFITESDVWIVMELMATCFDKLLKQLKQPIPEPICGKVAVATVKALHYLKERHGVIHR